MKNYKALKAASKVSIAKNSENEYYTTKKNYDADTGDALDDTTSQVRMANLVQNIENITKQISSDTALKEDYEQLKTDLEAL